MVVAAPAVGDPVPALADADVDGTEDATADGISGAPAVAPKLLLVELWVPDGVDRAQPAANTARHSSPINERTLPAAFTE